MASDLQRVALATGAGSPAPDVSVPPADLPSLVGVEALAFGSGLQVHEVGGSVGRAAVHELVLLLPAFMAEQERGTAVVAGLEGVGDTHVDPVVGAVDAPPDDFFGAAFDHFEDCRGFGGVADTGLIRSPLSNRRPLRGGPPQARRVAPTVAVIQRRKRNRVRRRPRGARLASALNASVDEDGTQQQIMRFNMPFGDVGTPDLSAPVLTMEAADEAAHAASRG